ncbi:SAM-dependent methyltransferase [Arthrobacter sp. NPDC057388]|uniref:SAM-dependent methyltransferase n=1 Tax=Arthrobacter sp. NPDC057388 TaxID=3346116 RepID=UPI0036295344
MAEPGGSTELKDEGLPLTALAVAAGRAVEASRPDPLVADPYASALVVAARSHLDLPTVWPAQPAEAAPLQQPLLLASIYIGMRTRFIDDFLQSGSPTLQTVVLGAGLDTRAFRLAWPAGARVFELDSANVLEFKAHVLSRLSAEPGCEVIPLGADLSLPWREPLLATGFDPGQPTTWVLEGVLPYLDAAAQHAALGEIAALSSSGSRAVIERAVPIPKTDDMDTKLREFSEKTGLPMSQLLARADPPDPVELLEAAGWRCNASSVEDLCSKYGRVLSLDPATDAGVGAPEAEQPQAEQAGPETRGQDTHGQDQSRGGFVTAWLP